jgi:hypothetical protein
MKKIWTFSENGCFYTIYPHRYTTRSYVMKKPAVILVLFIIMGMSFADIANAEISIEGGLTQEKDLHPGETYQGVLMIKNQDEKPQELKVYQTDYFFNYQGQTTYGEPGKETRSNAAWITFSPQRFSIPPLAEATINYTIKVPDDKALAGAYWSMLMVEQIAESSPEAGAKIEKKLTLGRTQFMRYGIQMVTTVGDAGKRHVRYVQIKLLKDKDEVFLQVDVENDGETFIRPQLWAELLTLEGTSLGKFKGDQFRLFPGTSKRFKIDIPNVSPGTYKALVFADCGDKDVSGIMYTLKFEH